jgi:hypothetical protein
MAFEDKVCDRTSVRYRGFYLILLDLVPWILPLG